MSKPPYNIQQLMALTRAHTDLVMRNLGHPIPTAISDSISRSTNKCSALISHECRNGSAYTCEFWIAVDHFITLNVCGRIYDQLLNYQAMLFPNSIRCQRLLQIDRTRNDASGRDYGACIACNNMTFCFIVTAKTGEIPLCGSFIRVRNGLHVINVLFLLSKLIHIDDIRFKIAKLIEGGFFMR